MATANESHQSEEWWTSEKKKNSKILHSILTQAEKMEYEIFHEKFSKDPKTLYQELNKHRKTIKKLRNDKKVSPGQYFRIFPKGEKKETDSKNYDLPLLTKLISNFCGLTPPTKGWTLLPDKNDQSKSAQIVRLTIGRHMIQHGTGHVSEDIYKEISTLMINAMIALGVDKKEFKKLLSPITYGVLPPIDNFTGREKDLDHIKSIIAREQGEIIRLVIHAMPGFGKSELTRQFCQDYGDNFDIDIIWINASTEESMKNSFVNIAEINKLSIKDERGDLKGIEAIVQAVHYHFHNENLLYVFDDAGSMESIINFLPKYKPSCTLITTQNTNWTEPEFLKYELLKFTEDECNKFLHKNITVPLSNHQVDQVLVILAGHPLALQQFTSLINQTMIGLDEFLAFFNSQPAEVLDCDISTIHGEKSVIKIIQIATNKLSQKDELKLSHEMINVICYLYGEEISFKVIKMIFDDMNKFEVEKTLKQLCSLSLVTKRKLDDDWIITVHSLVQQTLRFQQEKMKTYDQYIQKCLVMFFNEMEQGQENIFHTDFGQKWYKHFENLIAVAGSSEVFLEHCYRNGPLLHGMMTTKESYEALVKLYKLLLQKYDYLPNRSNAQYFNTMFYLADCLRLQNKFNEAIEICKKLLEIENPNVGQTESETFRTKNILASCLESKGDFNEAIQLLQEVLEKQLVQNHPETLATMNTLAKCLKSNGDTEKAIQILEQARKILEMNITLTKKDENSNTMQNYLEIILIHTKTTLASCFQNKGDYKRAIQLFEDVIEKRTLNFGRTHPDTLISMNNLAFCLQSIRQFDQAFKMIEEILETQAYPDTLETKNNLACCLEKTDDVEGAIRIHKEVLEERILIFGPNHPNTLMTTNNLACCLGLKGDYKKAIQYFEDVIEKRTLILGPSHPDTLTSMKNLRLVYSWTE